eukprot:GGOE01056614.1.p2 GENE.GGOE01056614.1~~GGOE01056614.1.p2  ORF type:complete len:112 (+),score=23.39 GGOE01056614.1:425-760(+)
MARCGQTLLPARLAVLCGDFNFDAERNYRGDGPLENAALALTLPGYTDVWPALRGGEKGFTYDSRANPTISHHQQMRYDRVCCKGGELVPKSIEMVGTNPLNRPSLPALPI